MTHCAAAPPPPRRIYLCREIHPRPRRRGRERREKRNLALADVHHLARGERRHLERAHARAWSCSSRAPPHGGARMRPSAHHALVVEVRRALLLVPHSQPVRPQHLNLEHLRAHTPTCTHTYVHIHQRAHTPHTHSRAHTPARTHARAAHNAATATPRTWSVESYEITACMRDTLEPPGTAIVLGARGYTWRTHASRGARGSRAHASDNNAPAHCSGAPGTWGCA
jgi:hypothetical protein